MRPRGAYGLPLDRDLDRFVTACDQEPVRRACQSHAGPSLDPPFGIIVFEAATEEEARRLIDADPSVASGLKTPELHPFARYARA
jgi:hypothetical protein